MDSIFEFEFERRYRPLLRALGVNPSNAAVTLTAAGRLVVRFGRWVLDTPIDNVASVEVTGDYRWFKAIGVRGSLADRGVTFGTNPDSGLCVKFKDPVPALLPFGLIKHPGMTVTVADPAGLGAALEKRLKAAKRKKK